MFGSIKWKCISSNLSLFCLKNNLFYSFNEKIAAVERKVEALVRMVMDDVSNIYEGLNGLQQLLHYFQRTSFEPLLKEQSCMVHHAVSHQIY